MKDTLKRSHISFLCTLHKHEFTWCPPWALCWEVPLAYHIPAFQLLCPQIVGPGLIRLLFSHQQMLAALAEETTWERTVSHWFSRPHATAVSPLDHCNDLSPRFSAFSAAALVSSALASSDRQGTLDFALFRFLLNCSHLFVLNKLFIFYLKLFI